MSESEDKSAHLRLASVNENVEKTRERDFATWQLRNALAKLFANMLRLARSQGRNGRWDQFWPELIAVHEAMLRFQDAFGHQPGPDVIGDGLDYRSEFIRHFWDEGREHKPNDHDHDDWAENNILDAACKIMAARVLGQDLQVRLGEKELVDAINQREHQQERRRERYAEYERGLKGLPRLKPHNPWHGDDDPYLEGVRALDTGALRRARLEELRKMPGERKVEQAANERAHLDHLMITTMSENQRKALAKWADGPGRPGVKGVHAGTAKALFVRGLIARTKGEPSYAEHYELTDYGRAVLAEIGQRA